MKQAETRLLQHPTGEPKDQRRPLKADDLRLSAEAKTLLESLAPGLRPNLLPERFPRVMNEIARRVKAARDADFIERDEQGRRLQMLRTIGTLGGATLDIEENYLIKKLFGGGLGVVSIENQARI